MPDESFFGSPSFSTDDRQNLLFSYTGLMIYRQLKAAEKPTQMSLPPGVCMKLKWNYTNSIINQLSIEYSVL